MPKQKSIKLFNHQKLTMTILSGEVVDKKIWYETQNHILHGNPLSLSMQKQGYQKILIRELDQQIVEVDLQIDDASLEIGQQLIFAYYIYIDKIPSHRENYLFLYNKNSEKFYEFHKNNWIDWLKARGLLEPRWYTLLCQWVPHGFAIYITLWAIATILTMGKSGTIFLGTLSPFFIFKSIFDLMFFNPFSLTIQFLLMTGLWFMLWYFIVWGIFCIILHIIGKIFLYFLEDQIAADIKKQLINIFQNEYPH
jgi:hypothetical protein